MLNFFNGVSTWFDRINQIGQKKGVQTEYCIVSSGIQEIVEGTEIAKHFKKIYACEFLYDYNEIIQWPKFAVNYTGKTQFLFHIHKGILKIDSKSAEQVNCYTPESDRPGSDQKDPGRGRNTFLSINLKYLPIGSCFFWKIIIQYACFEHLS